MSAGNIAQDSRTLRMGLALTFGLVLFVGSVLTMDATRHHTLARAQSATIRYVDRTNGTDGGNDCTNHSAPCATIGYALGQAKEGDTILVAKGTYIENLLITKTVILEGAYEPVGWSRSLHHYTTTIDGNGSGRVIEVQSTLSETTVIDGFTITNGDGGISIRLSLVTIQNCRIVHNHAPDRQSGGGMRIDRSFVFITNTLIATNTAANQGGATYIVNTGGQGPESQVYINSSTVANNWAVECDGVFVSLSGCSVSNSIVWGHGDEDFCGLGYRATYSNIEMGLPGEGNISADPAFVDPANGDYHLRPDSPCIDAGTNDSAPPTDWEGDPRPLDGDRDGAAVTDIGADEFSRPRIYLPIIFKNFVA